MTTYRVGAAGATVFDAEGRVVARLLPGTIVVEGTIEATDTPAAAHDAQRTRAKRIHAYADKRLAPVADKATPSRRPDPRLSNCVLEGGRQKVYPPAEGTD